MMLPKLLIIISLILFSVIGVVAFFKEHLTFSYKANPIISRVPLEIDLKQETQVMVPALVNSSKCDSAEARLCSDAHLPDRDRIEELFNKEGAKLPIVETIIYKSHVPWLKGRPAWLSDYASYYETSRHFIARSLNGCPDYLKQELAEGNCFNVLRKDKNFQFYLVVDTSRCKMWFYYIDLDNNQKVLLKTYKVGLGRIDSSKASGLLTPLGKYTLGNRIAIYKPKMLGIYRNKKTEMMTVFGTRWIPFEKEIGICTAPAKGFGIHGTPWEPDASHQLIESTASIGKYESDGCIRLVTADIEELFAIIITKPAIIEIVRDFSEATFAGRNESF